MDMQNVAKLEIPEGEVRTIHDKNGDLLWGKVGYSVKYNGNTAQNGTPTPSAPVPVQTVTGEQTISINGTDHTVNLGSIELCKIGTYQDYIYKSGGTWYVHKEVGKENWTSELDYLTYVSGGVLRFIRAMSPQAVYNNGRSSNFKTQYFHFMASGDAVGGALLYNRQLQVMFSTDTSTTVEQFKTWLDSHPMSVYYPLATPTDTEITNQALVAQLDAIEQWSTRYGYNATVTGNLPIIIDRTAL